MKKVLKHSALVLTALALVACGNSKKASDNGTCLLYTSYLGEEVKIHTISGYLKSCYSRPELIQLFPIMNVF